MRQVMSILAGLLLALSIATTASAHSLDRAGCTDTVVATAAHFDGDCDQVPGDADKGYPHHHGTCHGHHVATPTSTASVAIDVRSADEPPAGTVLRLATSDTEAALRPPRA